MKSKLERDIPMFGIIFSVLFLPSLLIPADALVCESYDEWKCREDPTKCNPIGEYCKDGKEGDNMCIALWNYPNDDTTKEMLLVKKDCWSEQKPEDIEECVAPPDTPRRNPKTKLLMFTCKCMGDLCNANPRLYKPPEPKTLPVVSTSVTDVSENHTQAPMVTTTTSTETLTIRVSNSGPTFIIVTVAVVLFCAVGAAIFIVVVCKRFRGRMMDGKKPGAMDPESLLQMAPLMSKEYENQDGNMLAKNVQLLERKATGRYGEVWRGKVAESVVAIKITPMAEVASWRNEIHVYHKFLMTNPHPNILRFIMSWNRVPEGRMFLVTEYHPLGSLTEVLKGRVVHLEEAEKVMCSMLAGVAFLHDSTGKPSIAHRDFKSTNVLIKNDLTACIGDFGLATAFEPDERIGDKHGQVGTRRYMAPELLEGAISLNVASFLRVDVYACGLVLWEILSRCQLCPDEPVGMFKLPFEEELGVSPTNDAIQNAVVQRRLRPVLKSSWKSRPQSSGVCLTIEECWDADPEARPSASCLLNRLQQSAGMITDDVARCT